MRKSFVYASAAVAVSLAGCSTTPTSMSQASMVPQSRIYQPAMLTGSGQSTDATVVFVRDSGFLGGGCSHDVFVNNQKAFAIRSGEHITLRVPAGDYFFRLETGGGMCPNVATSQETILREGAKQVYRILLPSDMSLRLTRQE